MIELNKAARDYTIRVANGGINQAVFVSGVLSYIGGTHNITPAPYINYAGANTSADVIFLDDATVVPFPPIHPAQIADQTYKLVLNHTGAAWQWSLNGTYPFNESLEDITPLIFDPNELSNTNLAITTKNNTWVDLILIATNTGGMQPPHPIHKHSNKAHIIVSSCAR